MYYQQHFLRSLSTTEPIAMDTTSNNRETGVVKRFSKDKGYGFISKNSDGTDCFVHFKNINSSGFKTLEQGQEVEFSTVQGEKGIEARDVNVVNAGPSRMPFGGSSNNNSTSSRFGFGNSRRNQPSSSFDFGGMKSNLNYEQQDPSSSENAFSYNRGYPDSGTDNSFSPQRTRFDNNQKREMGSVKRWTGERGFGFIRRANGGPDLFCHVRSLKDGITALEEGQTVQFTIQTTDKGEEARNVMILDDDTNQTRQQETNSNFNSDQRQTGTVKRWIPEKGYGFLRRDSGESDVFVHLRELSDGVTSLDEGQTVEFEIKRSEKGETAHNVTVCNEN